MQLIDSADTLIIQIRIIGLLYVEYSSICEILLDLAYITAVILQFLRAIVMPTESLIQMKSNPRVATYLP